MKKNFDTTELDGMNLSALITLRNYLNEKSTYTSYKLGVDNHRYLVDDLDNYIDQRIAKSLK